VDGFVSNAIKAIYPEVAAYLDEETGFDNAELDKYFREYRTLKMTGRITSEFYAKASLTVTPDSVKKRDSLIQQYFANEQCTLLVVDAMGAEWLPMLIAMARERNLGVENIAVGEAQLPTSTKFNDIYWPSIARRLLDIKQLDHIVHNGAAAHETRSAEENLAAALTVIGENVLPRVAEGLTKFERVLLTADHGSSRLAVLAWQFDLSQTLRCEDGADIDDWRYRQRAAQGDCPPELEENWMAIIGWCAGMIVCPSKAEKNLNFTVVRPWKNGWFQSWFSPSHHCLCQRRTKQTNGR
jgi:hypothetical protein